MDRLSFIKTLLVGIAGIGMNSITLFNKFKDGLKEKGTLMPVLFIGHGSPMNGIEDNLFSRQWKQLASEIPVPEAVLVISAHWLTKGTKVTAMEAPKQYTISEASPSNFLMCSILLQEILL